MAIRSPLPGRSLPPIRPWQTKLEPFSINHERMLLENINGVLARRGDPPIEFLADILNGDETSVFSVPLVDPYAAYRSKPQLPPFNLPTGITPLPIDQRRKKGVYFYMPRSHPDLSRAIDAVKATSVACEAYISDIRPDVATELAAPGFTIHAQPQPFERVIPEARLIIHHGGLSTAIAAVLAGTPQIIFPWNLEHLVTAKQIESLGASVTAAADWPIKEISSCIRTMVQDKPLAMRAAKAADEVQFGDGGEALEHVVARCLALMK
jgi:rhamnosyltransferase subunit B